MFPHHSLCIDHVSYFLNFTTRRGMHASLTLTSCPGSYAAIKHAAIQLLIACLRYSHAALHGYRGIIACPAWHHVPSTVRALKFRPVLLGFTVSATSPPLQVRVKKCGAPHLRHLGHIGHIGRIGPQRLWCGRESVAKSARFASQLCGDKMLLCACLY
jgi:hypothetical protein